MTTTTVTPFVSTPFGVGVVEVTHGVIVRPEKLFVRFEDGSRRWVLAAACTLDAPRPDWYREPETAAIPGYVG